MKFGLQIFKPKVKEIENEVCLNCGRPFVFHDNFCAYCGQKNTSKKLSFGIFLNNLVSGFFSYDSRFWTTFIPLLTKPGKVSIEFIEGKRVRFVNPFQLYLNVSIIFFLILGISNRINSNNEIDHSLNTSQNFDSITQNNLLKLDSVISNTKNKAILNSPNDIVNEKIATSYHKKSDSAVKAGFFGKINDFQNYYSKNPKLTAKQALDSLGYKNTFWNEFYYQQTINSIKNLKKIQSDGGKEYVNKLLSYISISLFVFLPFFTIFLMLLYFRRTYTYMEHLVFVFNTQTVFFLLLSIFYLLNFMVDLNNLAWVFILAFLLYLYKAMRNFYKQSRLKTIVKCFILNSFYMFLAFFGFVIVAVISFVIG